MDKIYSLPWDKRNVMDDERIRSLQRTLETECYETTGDIFHFLCTAPEKEWILKYVDAYVVDEVDGTGYIRHLIVAKNKAAFDQYVKESSENPD